MKKKTRLLALLLAGLLCLSLTGCKELDDMRACQAFWQEDGALLWKDTVYKPLPQTELELNGPADEKDDWEITVFVTDPDVPVLLSQSLLGTWLTPYQDGLFLTGEGSIYCAADRYEEMAEMLYNEQANLTGMCYTYDDVDEDGVLMIAADYQLTAEQVEAVKTVHETVVPLPTEDGMYLQSDHYIDLYGVTANGCFKKSLFDLEVAGDTYYLTEEGEDGNLYRVPDEYASVFKEIFAPMLEAEKRMEEMWEDELWYIEEDEWDT